MAVAAVIVIVVVVVSVACAWAAAVIVTTLLVGTVDGAVYSPLLSIVPVPLPATDQVTKVLLRLVIVAVHCTCPPTVTEDAAQEATMVGVVDVLVVLLPQEFRANRAGRTAKIGRKRCHHDSRKHAEFA